MSKLLFKVKGEVTDTSVMMQKYLLWDYTWSFYDDYTAAVDNLRNQGPNFELGWRVIDGKLEAYRDGLERWLLLPDCAQEAYQRYLASVVTEKLTVSDKLSISLRRLRQRLRRAFTRG